ncbi:MAG: hypothetical protein ACYTF1_02495 [Planctomycetota bacterium]
MNKLFWRVAVFAGILLAMGIGTASASLPVSAMNEDFEVASANGMLGEMTPIGCLYRPGKFSSAGEPWGFGQGPSLLYKAGGFTTNTTQVLEINQTKKVGSNYGPYMPCDVTPANQGPSSCVWLMDLDVAMNGTDQHSKLYFRMAGGGTLFELWFEAGTVTIGWHGATVIGSVTQGQWYHITLTIDLDNDNVDAAVDGVPVLMDHPINDSPRWDNVGAQTYLTYPPSETYLDNIVVSQLVDIDILPSDDINLFTVNMQGKGRLPIAILGSECLDVTQIDVESISIAEVVLPVKEPKAEEDANGDGIIDLMVHVSRRALIAALGLDEMDCDGTVVEVTVDGALNSGRAIVGTDEITLECRND